MSALRESSINTQFLLNLRHDASISCSKRTVTDSLLCLPPSLPVAENDIHVS